MKKKVSETIINEILQKYYGFSSFKGPQLQIISDIMSGHDVLAILGTGSGKSLCYQLPAIYMAELKKTTIVIEPVLALMNNQCYELNLYLEQGGANFRAITINSQTTEEELEDFQNNKDKYRIIYVSPEKFANASFYSMIKDDDVAMIVVDEAHCVSLWGHDFRLSYSKIGAVIRKRFKKRPVISAFTATATGHVIGDIIDLLDLRIDISGGEHIYKDRIIRENLNLITYDIWFLINRYCPDLVEESLKIYHKTDPMEIFTELKLRLAHFAKSRFVKNYILSKQDSLGIIYCNTKSDVRLLCKYLSGETINIDCAAYFGVSDVADSEDVENSETIRQQNAETMNRFYNDEKLSCVVATTAFGMGIDKSRGRDVTYIINFSIPMSLESFYQEIGRAGRHTDDTCDCILLYDSNDAGLLTAWLEYNPEYTEISSEYKLSVDRIKKMDEYGKLNSCEERNSFIENYFESYAPPFDSIKPSRKIYLNRSWLGWYLIKPINLTNDEMPDFFDVMVLDAINTHIIEDTAGFSYLDILRTLSGKDYFDSKSPLQDAVKNSLVKLKNVFFQYVNEGESREIRLLDDNTLKSSAWKRGEILSYNEDKPSVYFAERAIYYKMPVYYLGLPDAKQKKKYEDNGSKLSSMPQTKEGLMIKYYLLQKITYARYLYMSYKTDERYDRKLINTSINLSNMLIELGVSFPNTPKGDFEKKKRLFVYINDYFEALKDYKYIGGFVFGKTKRYSKDTIFLYGKDKDGELKEYNTVRMGYRNK